MKAFTIILGALISAASAAPVEAAQAATPSPSYKVTNWTTNFEQTDNSAIVPQFPVPGPGRGLQWNIGQAPYHYAAGFCFGICPDTFPAAIAFNTSSKDKSASITSIFPNSKTFSWDLKQFAFGCDTPKPYNANGNVNYITQPISCTVEVWGQTLARTPLLLFKQDYVPQIFNNPRLGAPAANMATAKLPQTWTGLTTVWFNATTKRTADTPYAPTLYLDSFQYTTRNVTK